MAPAPTLPWKEKVVLWKSGPRGGPRGGLYGWLCGLWLSWPLFAGRTSTGAAFSHSLECGNCVAGSPSRARRKECERRQLSAARTAPAARLRGWREAPASSHLDPETAALPPRADLLAPLAGHPLRGRRRAKPRTSPQPSSAPLPGVPLTERRSPGQSSTLLRRGSRGRNSSSFAFGVESPEAVGSARRSNRA